MAARGFAQLVREHGQVLVLAADGHRQLLGLRLDPSLQRPASGDVADVPLDDLGGALAVEVADDLDLDLAAVAGLERQVVVADVPALAQGRVRGAAGVAVPEQADLPELLAQEVAPLAAQEFGEEGVGLEDDAGVGVEDEDAVAGGLEEAAVAQLGGRGRRPVSDGFVRGTARGG